MCKYMHAGYLIQVFKSRLNEFPFSSLEKQVDFPEYKLYRDTKGNTAYFMSFTNCNTLKRSRKICLAGEQGNPELYIDIEYERQNQCAGVLVSHVECHLDYSELDFSIDIYYEREQGKWRWRIEVPKSEKFSSETEIIESPPHDIVQEIINFIDTTEIHFGVR